MTSIPFKLQKLYLQHSHMLIVLVQMNTNCYFQSDPCKAEDFSEDKAKEKLFSTLL